MIYDTWKHGNIDVRPVNDSRIRYVLDYINKDPIFPDSKYELYGDFEPPFYHYSKGLGFEEIYNLYNSGQIDQFGQIKFTDTHIYTIPPYLKEKLGLSSKNQLFPDSVIEWKNEKGFSDLFEACKNRSRVVERVNTQKVVARGKYKTDFIKLQDQESLDRLQRFNGFTDYDSEDLRIGFAV